MLLNRIEYAMMNNRLRAAIQRRFEARRLLAMGGPLTGGRALEIGCGRGVGVEIILELFGADSVDAFDLDPRMISLARKRLSAFGQRLRLWTGDAAEIAAPDGFYDAVFDFGIIHHIPNWRDALGEVARVLKPGGRFYAEEILARFIRLSRGLLDHPQTDRFDSPQLLSAVRDAGLRPIAAMESWGSVAWLVATKPPAR